MTMNLEQELCTPLKGNSLDVSLPFNDFTGKGIAQDCFSPQTGQRLDGSHRRISIGTGFLRSADGVAAYVRLTKDTTTGKHPSRINFQSSKCL